MKFLNKNVKIALTVLVGLVLLYWGVNYFFTHFNNPSLSVPRH